MVRLVILGTLRPRIRVGGWFGIVRPLFSIGEHTIA